MKRIWKGQEQEFFPYGVVEDVVAPSVRKALQDDLDALHVALEELHDSDLHEGDHGTDVAMTFCPGCEGHVRLWKIRDNPNNRGQALAALTRVEQLVSGHPGAAGVAVAANRIRAVLP